jgi:hypothetical protein
MYNSSFGVNLLLLDLSFTLFDKIDYHGTCLYYSAWLKAPLHTKTIKEIQKFCINKNIECEIAENPSSILNSEAIYNLNDYLSNIFIHNKDYLLLERNFHKLSSFLSKN